MSSSIADPSIGSRSNDLRRPEAIESFVCQAFERASEASFPHGPADLTTVIKVDL